MKKQLFALSFGFAVLIAATNISRAQTACAEHAAVVARLAETYGETRRSIGLASNNTVLEVFASEESGTWTITVTAPGGPTCLVASGIAYQAIADELPAAGKGA